MKKDVPLKEFAKYLLVKMIVEPVKLIYEILRKLMYPKAWFYALFTVFALRIIWIRDYTDSTDIAILIAMVVLVIWQEWGSFSDDYKHKQRKEIREKAIKEHMKGK